MTLFEMTILTLTEQLRNGRRISATDSGLFPSRPPRIPEKSVQTFLPWHIGAIRRRQAHRGGFPAQFRCSRKTDPADVGAGQSGAPGGAVLGLQMHVSSATAGGVRRGFPLRVGNSGRRRRIGIEGTRVSAQCVSQVTPLQEPGTLPSADAHSDLYRVQNRREYRCSRSACYPRQVAC